MYIRALVESLSGKNWGSDSGTTKKQNPPAKTNRYNLYYLKKKRNSTWKFASLVTATLGEKM